MNKSTSNKNTQEDAINVINYPSTRTSDLYVDSADSKYGGYAVSSYESSNNLIPLQISRLGLKYVNMSYRIPNMNQSNNLFKFQIDAVFPDITFSFEDQEFVNAEIMLDDIKNKMETETLAQVGIVIVITFTQINNTDVFEMTSSLPIRFITCNGISFGQNLHGIPYTDGYFTSIKILPRMYYTNYLDILITEVRDNSILQHKFSADKRFSTTEHVSRIYIPFINRIEDDGTVISRQKKEFAEEKVNINYYAYRHRDVSTFKITLIDEYENVITSSIQNISTINPIEIINSEIPYLKYNIVLSIIE